MLHQQLSTWLKGMTSDSVENTWSGICAHASELNADDFRSVLESLTRDPKDQRAVESTDPRLRALKLKVDRLIEISPNGRGS